MFVYSRKRGLIRLFIMRLVDLFSADMKKIRKKLHFCTASFALGPEEQLERLGREGPRNERKGAGQVCVAHVQSLTLVACSRRGGEGKRNLILRRRAREGRGVKELGSLKEDSKEFETLACGGKCGVWGGRRSPQGLPARCCM